MTARATTTAPGPFGDGGRGGKGVGGVDCHGTTGIVQEPLVKGEERSVMALNCLKLRVR